MKALVFTAGALVLASAVSTAQAHPGRTASDGCHYCRTNCSSWGVPAGQRHCHGSGLNEEVPGAPAALKVRLEGEHKHDDFPHSHGNGESHSHERKERTQESL